MLLSGLERHVRLYEGIIRTYAKNDRIVGHGSLNIKHPDNVILYLYINSLCQCFTFMNDSNEDIIYQ